jgi:hypothetical protein
VTTADRALIEQLAQAILKQGDAILNLGRALLKALEAGRVEAPADPIAAEQTSDRREHDRRYRERNRTARAEKERARRSARGVVESRHDHATHHATPRHADGGVGGGSSSVPLFSSAAGIPEEAGSTEKHFGNSGLQVSHFSPLPDSPAARAITVACTPRHATPSRHATPRGATPPVVDDTRGFILTPSDEPKPKAPRRGHKSTGPAPGFEYPALFEQFWKAFPRKKKKWTAYEAWTEIGAAAIMDTILAKIAELCASDDNWRRRTKYVPYPATWLRAHGWLDEPDVATPEPPRLTAKERRDIALREQLRAQGLDPDQIIPDPLERRRRIDEIVRESEHGEIVIDVTPSPHGGH